MLSIVEEYTSAINATYTILHRPTLLVNTKHNIFTRHPNIKDYVLIPRYFDNVNNFVLGIHCSIYWFVPLFRILPKPPTVMAISLDKATVDNAICNTVFNTSVYSPILERNTISTLRLAKYHF